MKKNVLIKIVATLMITSIIPAQILPKDLGYKKVEAKDQKSFEKLEDDPTLRFAVLSDTHVGPNKLREQKRLKDVFSTIYELDPDIDAVSIVGDITDSGTQNEYDVFKSIIDKNKKEDTDLVISMGNHEGDTEDRFKKATGRDPKENLVINGYHFITVSARSSDTVYGGSRYNLDEDWLREQLEAAYQEDPTKPIFVFTHHGMKDTAYGTDEWYTNDLKKVLDDYPQVIHFGGHSHYPLNDPRSIHQKDFTSINTSTISYFELESGMMYGTVPPNANNAYQIMVLDVNNKSIRVRKLDLLSGQYIGEDWVFDTASGKGGFKYTDDRKENSSTPYFENTANARVENIKDTGCTITIDQGKIKDKIGDNNDEIVHSYKYDFYDKKTGKLHKSYKIWSEFYFLPMKNTLIQTFNGLKPGTEYEVEVTAMSSYKKLSSNTIKASFKTSGGFEEPSEEEMAKPVEKAEMLDVDFRSGNASDSSITNNNVKVSGSPKIQHDEKLNKNVATFNGSSAYMYGFDDEKYSKIKKNVSMETVFKLDTFKDNFVDIFSNMESAGLGFEVSKIPGDNENVNLEFWVRVRNGLVGTGAYQKISATVKYGEYYHALATYDGNLIKLYINGELENSKEAKGEVYYPTGSSKVFAIGSDINSTGGIQAPMTGNISVARLYNRTLTDIDAYKLNKKELEEATKEYKVKLDDLKNIEGKSGTEINMPIVVSNLNTNNKVRSAEIVLDIPKDLEVKGVKLNKKSINAQNFDYNVDDNKLRIALTNTNKEDLFLDKTSGNKEVATINFVLKEDKKDSETTKVKATNFVLRCDENKDIIYDVSEGTSTIEFVKGDVAKAFVRELYTSSGADVIEGGYKAYAIEFVGRDIDSSVKSNKDIPLYYNGDFTKKNNKLTYITLVDESVSKEILEDISNYEFDNNKPNLKNTVTFGDINNDGIDAQDALSTVTSWLRIKETSEKEMLTINTSGDGAINTRDAIEVVDKFVSGKDFNILSK
ncbi:MAG: LamG-like jellyroll fold domain-containing protein [Terrisporobacter sp.]